MTVTNRIYQKLKAGGEITGGDIAALINEHKIPRERMIGLYNRYTCTADQDWYTLGNSPTVFKRRFEVDLVKVNNQINIDHFSNIIRTKTGYFVGEPITYSVSNDAKNKETVEAKLKEFLTRIDAPDLDTETGKMASLCGYGARLCFIHPTGDPEAGKEDAMNIPPWECVFLSKDGSITSPEYALRYYKTQVEKADGTYKDIMKAEWYDGTNVSFWTENTVPEPVPGTFDPATVVKPMRSYGFMLDPNEPARPHMFEGVPLIGFPNNEELQGDAEKVLAIIDAVDRTVSDVNSEIEQFRLAYLAIYGYANIDEKFMKEMKKTGCIGFSEPTDRAEFITKVMDGTTIEAHLNRLEQAIYHISGIPDMRDAAFSGNSSGVALKFKIMPMENLCKMAENKFSAALRQMFKVIASKWAIEQVQFSSEDLTFKFKRNFPLNLLDEAQTAQALTGIVSQETVLGTLSIVKDPKEEMEKMRAEQVDAVNLDAELYPELPQDPNAPMDQNGQPMPGQDPDQNGGESASKRMMDYEGVTFGDENEEPEE
jgi:SPP1 family phage portal protein